MKITSPAFENSKAMPAKYTCDGENVSPPLKIEDVPEKAKSLALIAEDPDAPSGNFVHWAIWNLPTSTKEIKEGEKIGSQGRNDFGKLGYGGPCPPSGIHRYFFRLYALDGYVHIPEGSRASDVKAAMNGQIIEEASIIGRYSRSLEIR